MDYMTLKEASEKWGISSRQVNYYCVEGRIPGAAKIAGVWLIPKDAEKPIDGRRKVDRDLKNDC
jgi:predicted site-specific integrase-resolvase